MVRRRSGSIVWWGGLACVAGCLTLVLWPARSRAQDSEADAEMVARIEGWTVSSKQMTDQLRHLPAPLLASVKRDENAARNFAFEWWAAALLAAEAKDSGLFRRQPGLRGAAEAASRAVVSKAYIEELMNGAYAPTDKELEQTYAMRKNELCASPARYRVSVVGVRWGAKASPDEIALAEKRLAEIQRRLAAGEDFAKVADELSDLPQKLPGGELGWVTEAELVGTEGAEEVKRLGVGERTEVIRSKSSAVVYSMLERGEAEPLPLELCKDQLRAVLNAQFQRDIAMRRMDEVAEAKNASMNFDAFLAALRAVPSSDESAPARTPTGR